MLFATPTEGPVLIFCILVGSTVLSNGQQLVLEGPSLSSGRQNYCLDEELEFTCTGPGTGIQWDVPSVFNGEAFADSQSPTSRPISGVDATITLQQAMPTFITTLRIRNVPDITVICSTDTPDSKNLSLTTSTIPPLVRNVVVAINDESGPVNVNWDPISGTFDLLNYRVQLCVNGVCLDVLNTTSTSMAVEMTIPDDTTIYAQVSAVSQCGGIGSPARSMDLNVQILPRFYQDLTAVIILGVLVGLLVISNLVILILCIKYCHRVKVIDSGVSGPTVEKLNMN